MASQPEHPRLADHNARVRRWVKDFDDTALHPILLVLGYGVDLDDSTYKYSNVALANGMARYRKGKVPAERTVQRQLRKLESAGIVKPDRRFRPSGRETFTRRAVDFRQAVRFGQPVEHLWDAPVAGDVTPDVTPDVAPSLSLPISELASRERAGLRPSERLRDGRAAPDREKADPPAIEDAAQHGKVPARDRAERDAGMCNTFIVWKVKGTGKTVHFRTDKPSRQIPPKHAKKITLSPAEASFMFRLLSPREQPGFLLASQGHRQYMMDRLDGPGARAERKARQADQEEHARKLKAREEARPGAERAELEPLITRYCELSGQDAAAVRHRIEVTGGTVGVFGRTADDVHQSRMQSLKGNIWKLETGQPELW